jgi:hypothetical protein
LFVCQPELCDDSNLVALYGLHEKFVNNLVSRFDEGLISDMHALVFLIFGNFRCIPRSYLMHHHQILARVLGCCALPRSLHRFPC